jgi:predicted transcriptional regulator
LVAGRESERAEDRPATCGSRQAVFKHLVVLEEAGLISRRKQGRELLYQVQAGRSDELAVEP